MCAHISITQRTERHSLTVPRCCVEKSTKWSCADTNFQPNARRHEREDLEESRGTRVPCDFLSLSQFHFHHFKVKNSGSLSRALSLLDDLLFDDLSGWAAMLEQEGAKWKKSLVFSNHQQIGGWNGERNFSA
jgi:hypothetical protein